MAYTKVTTRTSADANASADINQLQDNFDSFLNANGSATEFNFSSTTSTTGLHTESGTLKWKGDTVSTAVASSGSNIYYYVPAGSFDYPDSNPAPLAEISGTNNKLAYHPFDDSTDESLLFSQIQPDDFTSADHLQLKLVTTKRHNNTGTVGWNIVYNRVSTASWDTAKTTSINRIASSIAGTMTAFDTMSTISLTTDRFWSFEVVRDVSATGNMTGDSDLMGIEIGFIKA